MWDRTQLPRAFDRAAEFDFRVGIPDARFFPFDAWRRLEARGWRRSVLGKGIYGEPAGDTTLRNAIAQHITVARGVRARAEDIVVTNGTQQAVDVVARALLRPGDVVAVEDPGYAPARWLFESLDLRVVGVPVDDEGLMVSRLPRVAKLLFVSPSHQFPLGTAMSLRRRMALTEWAEEHDAAILEDDYDSEFRLSGRPIEPLQLLDRTGRVVYIGTFSKTLLAQLRIGFVIVPESIRRAVEAAKFVTDWHTALPTQRTLAAFIEEGAFARHVRRMRGVYRERHERIVSILRRDFADQLTVVPASAGVHVSALAVKSTADEMGAVVKRAWAASVAVQELATFAVGTERRAGLLLGYGAIATEHIDEGLHRLRASFDAEEG
jgi:GntR family transcriptional regulator/MocR family aminotransferase